MHTRFKQLCIIMVTLLCTLKMTVATVTVVTVIVALDIILCNVVPIEK